MWGVDLEQGACTLQGQGKMDGHIVTGLTGSLTAPPQNGSKAAMDMARRVAHPEVLLFVF